MKCPKCGSESVVMLLVYRSDGKSQYRCQKCGYNWFYPVETQKVTFTTGPEIEVFIFDEKPDLPPEAENQLRQVAKNIAKVAKATSVTAEKAKKCCECLHRISCDYFDSVFGKFTKLNIDVCAGCRKRSLFDFNSAEDHPCPLYNKTMRCKIRHFLRRLFK